MSGTLDTALANASGATTAVIAGSGSSSPTAVGTSAPSAIDGLVRGALLFIVADSLFGSFGTAFVFSQCGLRGVLAFMIGWQLVSTAAYVVNVYQFKKGGTYAARTYRNGVAGMMAAVLTTGVLTTFLHRASPVGVPVWLPVVLLGVLGGGARGRAFSARTWLELNLTGGSQRQGYLSRTEALGTLLRLGIPLLAAAVLAWAHNAFGLFFVMAGGAGFVCVLVFSQAGTVAPAAIPAQPWKLLGNKSYWKTAPFYVVDGAGHALRTGLFVSGAMAVIGSASKYGLVDTGASLCAAGLLWWQSRHPASAPSLKTLRRSLALMGFAWLALFAALRQPLLLPLFVAAYALGNPLITVVKSGLTLKGLAQAGAAPQDNLIARMMLLTLGRVSALSLALAVTYAMATPTAQLVGSCLLAAAMLPLDYIYSRRLSRGA